MCERGRAVEKGLHLLSFPGPGPLEQYGRLYIGDDFCERLTPAASGLEEILEFARHNDKKITLLTAYCTREGLNNLEPVLKALNSSGSEIEVVVNDLGVLRILNGRFRNLTAALGRLYTSGLLRPYFWNSGIFEPNSEILKFYRGKYELSAEYFDFLRENRVTRVEFDNVCSLPLFAERFASEGFGVSMYYPFTFITTSRRCLFAGGKLYSNKPALPDCSKECLGSRLILQNKTDYPEQKIFVKGNAQFIRRKPHGLAADCGKWGADRLVTFTD
jgi:hypothetical protein